MTPHDQPETKGVCTHSEIGIKRVKRHVLKPPISSLVYIISKVQRYTGSVSVAYDANTLRQGVLQSSAPTLSARYAGARQSRAGGECLASLAAHCISQEFPLSAHSRHPCVHTLACVSGGKQVLENYSNTSLLLAYTTTKAMNRIRANRFSEI